MCAPKTSKSHFRLTYSVEKKIVYFPFDIFAAMRVWRLLMTSRRRGTREQKKLGGWKKRMAFVYSGMLNVS